MSQNGWAENATISGSKSSNIATSRSTHDSYPTCSPVVADHHSPGKFRWPLKVGNDLDGLARSNGASQHDGRGSRRWAPVSSMNDTTNEEPAVARIGTGEPLIVPHPREIPPMRPCGVSEPLARARSIQRPKPPHQIRKMG